MFSTSSKFNSYSRCEIIRALGNTLHLCKYFMVRNSAWDTASIFFASTFSLAHYKTRTWATTSALVKMYVWRYGAFFLTVLATVRKELIIRLTIKCFVFYRQLCNRLTYRIIKSHFVLLKEENISSLAYFFFITDDFCVI